MSLPDSSASGAKPGSEGSPPSAKKLDSWKEIADYLGREVRTVQRWEKTESLPVHRHEHLKKSTVYAYASELDDWRKRRQPVDDPVAVLRRVNDEWLDDQGCLFLVCPNANAASRQIAAKMGVVSHNAAVTESESGHGHRITYSFDTLERDVRRAGLKVVVRSGIFFKALANFQWDLATRHRIVSPEYLEGCYDLGMQYPDLCASIFLLCSKG